MRLPVLIVTVLILIGIFVDYYIWKQIVAASKRRWQGVVYAWSSLFMLIFVIVAVCLPRRSGSDATLNCVMWMLYGYCTIYIPKYLYCIISSIRAIPALWRSRRRWNFFQPIAATVAVLVFIVMWWAAIVNRISYQVKEVEIEFAGLPEDFDGYKIVQFSDFHVGTYGSDTAFVSEVVDVMNGLGADAIFFTGDIVNRRTDELLPFVKPLSRLHAPDGVFSILGNHDYGDYSTWKSEEDKAENLEKMKSLQGGMGWNLLNNETVYLHEGADSIALIGVENWGEPPFNVYGDLDKAYPCQSDSIFKILLTHNPMHWVEKVADNDTVNIGLALSGHTHAMQMQIGNWSPSKWRYDTWGGEYGDKSGERKLYVNIGLGTVAIPARIGATPEITLITLKRAK
ncbi:MAG: metallophosphoesterase [Lachnospiraceae bacterium]|nr:metallophosphoesterase [Lachnospiraceae bacterium]